MRHTGEPRPAAGAAGGRGEASAARRAHTATAPCAATVARHAAAAACIQQVRDRLTGETQRHNQLLCRFIFAWELPELLAVKKN